MQNVVAKSWVGVVVFGLVLSGCNCGSPPAEREISCSFTTPTDAVQLSFADDLDPATNDYQLNVEVQVKDQDGEDVELETATLQTRLTSEEEFVDSVEATLETGKATFDGATLRPSPNQLKVSAKAKGAELFCTKTITVNVGQVDPAAPAVLTVAFQGDANADKKLNRAELPGEANTAVVLVTTQNIEDGQNVTVKDAVSGVVYGVAQAASSAASVTLSDLPTVHEANYQLVVEVVSAAGVKNQITDANGANYNAAAFSALRIDLMPPTIAFTCPTKTVMGLADDDDPAKAGHQLKLCGQVSADTVEVRFQLGSEPEVPCTGNCVESGAAVVFLDVATSGTTMPTLKATAYDEGGNTAVVTMDVTLDFDPPTINITKPLATDGTLLFFNNTFEADVVGADGRTATIFRISPPSTTEVALDTKTVTAGKVVWNGTFPSSGTYDLVARVTDAAGNAAVPDTEAGIVVNGAGCAITITTPSTKPAYLTPKDDANLTLPGLQTYIRAKSANCPSTTVVLSVDGANPQAATTNATGDVEWFVTINASGSYNYRVEISNGGGQAPTPDSVDINVDLNVPVINFPTNNEKLLASGDTQRQTAGVQRLLSYTATVPTGGRVDICSDQTPAPGGSTACPDGATGWWVLKQGAMPSEPAFTFPEGTYNIKPVVVVPGVSFNAGVATRVVVDGVRPTVAQAILFANDAAPLGKLNNAELTAAGGAPRLMITTSEDVTITVRAQAGGTVFTSSATATASNMATVTLNQNITTTEQDYQLAVVLTDLNGNTNILSNPTANDPLDTHALLDMRVDKQAPSCSITAPTKNQLGVADDASGGTAGYQLRVSASTSTDVTTNGVTFTLSGGATPPAATVTAAGGAATHDFTVADTGTLTYNIDAACTDESGNSANATQLANITVDNDVPTCDLTAPTAAASPYGTFTIATTVNVGGTNVNGLPVKIFSKVGMAAETQVGTLTVSGASASGNVTYPNGTQDVRAEVTDLAGNVCSNSGRIQTGVVVNGVGCSISLTKPLTNGFINKADDTQPASPSTAEFNVTGNSSNCNSGQSVQIFQGGNGIPLASGTVDGSGNFSIMISLAEGVLDLEARIDNGAGVLTSDFANNVEVDVTDPTVSSASPTGANLYFVAATNANVGPNPPITPDPAYVADGTPGGNADVTVSVNGVTGAIGGQVRVVYAGSTVGSSSVTTSPQSFTIPVSLAHNTTGTFQIQVLDKAGNQILPTNAAGVVDVIAPAAPTVTPSIFNARRATVLLSWSPTYDDGSDSGSGGHAGYDIRWTHNAKADALGNETTAMSEADYFDSTKVYTESLLAWSSLAINHSLTMPPMATYYIAVRAKDEVGNYSTFSAPTALANPGTVATLTNPSGVGTEAFGSVMATNGSLNNDAFEDLVVAAPGPTAPPASIIPGAIYVYYGGAGFSSQATCTAPACQKIEPYEPAVNGSFGSDISIGNVGDAAGENKPDVVVAAPTYSSTVGRVFIYFGNNTQGTIDTATFIELRGTSGNFGYSARLINDVNNDGYMELAVAAPTETGSGGALQGKVYIFRGRSVAAWQALRTAQDMTSMAFYVPTSSADWVIEGPTPVVSGGNQFGRERGGFASLGDITGDSVPDFAVPDSKGTVNSLYLYSGAAIAAGSGTLQTSNAFQTLSHGTTGSSLRLSFGRRAIGLLDVYGATTKDLVVSHATDNQVHIFADPTVPPPPAGPFVGGPALSMTGRASSSFGSWFVINDFNDDAKLDIAVSESLTSNSSAWVMYSRSGSFDTTAGGGFSQSRSFGGSGSSRGITLATGDFDGSGKPDLAIGDDKTSPGMVTVWRP